MIYLIGQLSGWLFLTAAFAALAGWAYATQRAAPGERALQRDRGNLLRDLARLASGDGESASASDVNGDPMQSRADVRESRIAELERALEQARSRADSATADLADMQRRHERDDADTADLARLRADEHERGREIDVLAEPAAEEEAALQGWRLRYFEHRVQYLEGLARTEVSAAAAAIETAPSHDALTLEWRARDAEARAAHLEQELRSAGPSAGAVSEPADEALPFAANADVDTLLRWRLLYLERRVAHLQQAEVAPIAAPVAVAPTEAAPDPDRWKWRARYLEARVRHLEENPSAAPIAPVSQPIADEEEQDIPPAPLVPRGSEAKPATLAAARNGAPDDLTLIDGVSLQQQSTFYSLGVFHFDQIATWTPANVAWVDQYLRLRGRIVEEEWVEQAEDLAREGPSARRVVDEEEA